jgi:hypothetical protein
MQQTLLLLLVLVLSRHHAQPARLLQPQQRRLQQPAASCVRVLPQRHQACQAVALLTVALAAAWVCLCLSCKRLMQETWRHWWN